MGLRAAAVALLLSGAALAGPAPLVDRPLADPALETEARRLMRDIRCVTCEHQAILESHAPQAQQMRALVRAELAAGRSPGDVRAWLVARYGHEVSFRPPASPIAWPLWAAPLVFLAAGALAARRLLARR